MQINAEKFIEGLDKRSLDNNIFLISGNEPGLISKTEKLILRNIKSKEIPDMRTADYKINKNIDLNEVVNSRSLFEEKIFLSIKNPPETILDPIKNVHLDGVTIIINGEKFENPSNYKKLKKYLEKLI